MMRVLLRHILCLLVLSSMFPFVAWGEETGAPTGMSTGTPTAVLPVPVGDPATAKQRERIIELRGRYANGTKYRIKNLLENVKHRMSATSDRFDRISVRIVSRIKKLEARGESTTNARASLERAHAETTLAKQLILRVTDQSVDAIVDDVAPHARFSELRADIDDIRLHLQNAHDAYTLTITLLQTTQPQAHTATTTASSTAHKK